MKEQTLYEKHLKAIKQNIFADSMDEWIHTFDAAKQCETITKETAMSYLNWAENGSWFRVEKYYWARLGEDIKVTAEQLFSLYLSNAGETNQELNEKG